MFAQEINYGKGSFPTQGICEGTIGNQGTTSTSSIKVTEGLLGFEASMKGQLEFSSSFSTVSNNKIGISAMLPSIDVDPKNPPSDIDKYKTMIVLKYFLLDAKTTNAFWIPDGCKNPKSNQFHGALPGL